MLYATTRNNAAAYPPQRVLAEDRAPDGGLYVPAQLPIFSPQELELLLREPAGEIVARVLNLFFDTKLGALDVKYALGKRLFGLAKINHRIVIGELWRNVGAGFDGLCQRLKERVCTDGLFREPGLWMRIVCRTALVFAMYARLSSGGIAEPGECIDAAVQTGDFSGPYALWLARRMGLPIGEIICCSNENGGIWDLLNRGQIRLGAKPQKTSTPKCDCCAPPALELLVHGRLKGEDVEEFLETRQRGGTYFLEPDKRRLLREGISASVVSGIRGNRAIPNLYRTNGYILCPYSALVYTGLMDYRSQPGPRRMVLMLTDYDPRESADTVIRALAISDQELRDWCQHR